MLRKFIRDPLLHFLLLGGFIFAAYSWFSNADKSPPNDRLVMVDEAALVEFMQNRTRAFALEPFRERLANMDATERQRLIDDFVREEVLYREAKALGMDQDDYIIRRRLVQKAEFVTDTLSRRSAGVNDEELTAYFEENRERYYVEPSVTFTHVFFDADKHGRDRAATKAREKLPQLNRDAVPFAESVNHGDRFPFHLNYVDRTREFVHSHFGESFTANLFASAPDDHTWHGPFESTYGTHLVLLTVLESGRDARLDEVRGRVREDAETERKNELLREAVNTIIHAYDVRIEYPPPDPHDDAM